MERGRHPLEDYVKRQKKRLVYQAAWPKWPPAVKSLRDHSSAVPVKKMKRPPTEAASRQSANYLRIAGCIPRPRGKAPELWPILLGTVRNRDRLGLDKFV